MITECADKLAHLGEKLFKETEMKYKVGDKVRIKSIDWYNKNKDCNGCLICGDSHINSDMKCMLGEIVTIIAIDGNHYRIKEYGWN